jgi:2-C-methyl-D-erythritol 2,4-cyclodiphosphate synthase
MQTRVGLGYDLHRLVPERKLILGGVEIPADKGCLGHSDADVLIHSLIDALLGACGLGDIGQKFPDSDPAYAGISSLELLKQVMEEIRGAGFSVVNTDSVVVLEKPKISAYIDAMKANLYPLLVVAPDKISIKGKTAESMGEIGAGEVVACWSVVLVVRK